MNTIIQFYNGFLSLNPVMMTILLVVIALIILSLFSKFRTYLKSLNGKAADAFHKMIKPLTKNRPRRYFY